MNNFHEFHYELYVLAVGVEDWDLDNHLGIAHHAYRVGWGVYNSLACCFLDATHWQGIKQ